MNIEGKYCISDLSTVSKISHENEILSQRGFDWTPETPLNPTLIHVPLSNCYENKPIKNTENFTTKKNENFQIKVRIVYIFMLKTYIVGTR